MQEGAANARARAWGAGKFAGRRVSQSDVAEICEGHFNFLKRRNGGVAAVLSYSDLSGLDLSHASLAEVNFTGANLAGAKLTATILDRATLFSTDLRHSDLRYASLIGADVRGASLKGCDLSNAILDDADFRSAVMAQMDNGDLVKLTPNPNEQLGGVDFTGASLKGASFKGAVLKDVNFSYALLHGTQFRGASVRNVCLKGAVVANIARNELPFTDEELAECISDPSPSTIRRATSLLPALDKHEAWTTSDGKNGTPAKLDGEDLRPLTIAFRGRQFTAMSARKTIAIGTDFSDCQLQGVNFEGADLRDANFMRADLRGANFAKANLTHARFDAADIGILVLQDKRRVPLNLDGAMYREEQFARVKRDTV